MERWTHRRVSRRAAMSAAARILLAAACVVAVAALPVSAAHEHARHYCGSPEMHGDAMAAVATRLRASRVAKLGTSDSRLAAEQMAVIIQAQRLADRVIRAGEEEPGEHALITVPTYFHVLRSGLSVQEGNVPDEVLQDQVQVLNEVLGKFGQVEFRLMGITRTTNSSWAEDVVQPSRTVDEFKYKLRRGGPGTLNVYMTSFRDPQLLGIGLPPYFYEDDPIADGVTLNFRTMPDVPDGPEGLNAGGTLAHEVGHWLGLFHPFQGGCTDPDGDYIDDTPRQRDPQYGCTSSSFLTRDSCPASPGDDLQANIMDYYDDACLIELTQGQQDRIVEAFVEFRADERMRQQIQDPQSMSTSDIMSIMKDIGEAAAAGNATRKLQSGRRQRF